MATYHELSAQCRDLLKHTSRFVAVAFHVHSPDSHDWAERQHADGPRNNKTPLLAPGGETIYLNELAPHLQVACVTDHMKSGYACRLAVAAAKRQDVAVFPGMEVNCRLHATGADRIHLLAIFPPDKSVTEIDRIFSGMKEFPPEAARKGGEELVLDGNLSEWRRHIEDQGGILVVAHIDDANRGHRARFRSLRAGTYEMLGSFAGLPDVRAEVSEEYKAHIAESGAHALEVMNPEDRNHYISFKDRDGKVHRMPCVIRSDFHCFEDFGQRDRYTFVKVSRLSFQCLRESLKFFETRIKFKDDLLDAPSPRIVGVRVRSTNGGLFEDATIAFNANLNCLIGARGCGKSTIIEAIRYALGRNSELQESGQRSSGGYESLAVDIQKANLKDTVIEVLFETGTGEAHVLSATYDPAEVFTTEVFTLDGDLIKTSQPGVVSNYPVRIYSWSEIENLGRQPQLQRELLDRLIDKLPEYVERRNALYRDLSKSSASIKAKVAELAAKLDEERGTLRRFREYSEDFKLINTPEVSHLFEQLDSSRDRLALVEAVLREFETLREEVKVIPDLDATTIASRLLKGKPTPLLAWWDTELSPRLKLPELAGTTAQFKAQIDAAINERVRTTNQFAEEQKRAVANSEAAIRQQTNVSTSDQVARGRREQSKKRFDAASRLRDHYMALHDELQELLAARDLVVDQLEDVQNTISGARSASIATLTAKLNAFKVEGMEISIEFQAGSDRDLSCSFLRDSGFLSKETFGHYKNKQVAERACRMAKPTRIAAAILRKDRTTLTRDGSDFDLPMTLTAEEGQKLVEAYHPFSRNDDADVPVVDGNRLDQVMQLQDQAWDDALRINLNERPVDQLSPGQRSSAMLPLVALSETVPLIVDQPEDNLDQQMVGRTLTRILADLKERRQIIVATHNPNIVVGGDAEQVVVLKSVAARSSSVQLSGSIDKPDVINAVIGIMEGGKEAFQARQRRYQPYLSA